MEFTYFKYQENDTNQFGLIHNTNYFNNEIEALNFIQEQLGMVYDFNIMSLTNIVEAFDEAAADEQLTGFKYTANNAFQFNSNLMSIYKVRTSKESGLSFKEMDCGLVVYLVLEVEGLKIYFTSNYTFTEDADGNKTVYYFD